MFLLVITTPGRQALPLTVIDEDPETGTPAGRPPRAVSGWTLSQHSFSSGLPRNPSLDKEDPLEKEMATHSSTLAWKIPWMEEPGGLQSTGSQGVGHD